MSRGTALTPLRLSPELLARIDAEIERNNLVRGNKPYNRSTWIRMAIEERIAKLDRGRKGHAKRKGQTEGQDSNPAV